MSIVKCYIMYIYDVVPLTNIPRPNPQVLSYYYVKRLDRFSLVEIPLGKKCYPGVVLGGRQVKDIKSVLRKAYFQVKEIKRVIQQGPILFDWQFTLATFIADYYWASLGLVLKKFIPKYLYRVSSIKYRVLEKGRKEQVLWLFPDNSFFQKIELPEHFERISSRLTDKKEFQIFKKIVSGKGKIIIGTKRALFAPYNTLREVHVFEEADTSHKSWEQHPKYNAVRVAEELGKLHKAKVIYHSTLPSLHNFFNKIPFQPFDIQCRKLNDIQCRVIDLTKEKLKKPFSDEVEQALRDCYINGKQAILYVNRRGEGRFLLCRDCGFVPQCPNCELSLIFHIQDTKYSIQDTRVLLCHHCGYAEASPSLCAQCGSHEVRSYGFGTQRVQSELASLFPKANVFRLDSDTVSRDSLKHEIVEEFRVKGNFLVATSMIFQTHLEQVYMAASLNPDSEMNIPDFAQTERLFFNLWRLRNFAKKDFYIQTYNPSNSLFTYLQKADWAGFYQEELKIRKALNYPPFSSIIKLTYSHRSEEKARQEAEILYKRLNQQAISYFERSEKQGSAKAGSYKLQATSYQLLGPAPAFFPKLKGRYRYNILIKILNTKYPEGVRRGGPYGAGKIRNTLVSIVPPSWDMDVDPIDSL